MQKIVELLRPIDCGVELIRLGGNNDGGYLLPEDLAGIRYCFSAGVGGAASFELDCSNRGIPSFLADASVDGPPIELPNCRFLKKFIGPINNERFITLDRWIAESKVGDETDCDLLLQMDTEGAEYPTLLSTKSETLRKFRIIIVEFHNTENFSDKGFCQIVYSALDRIRDDFEVVHVHPNNYGGIVSVSNVTMPHVFEATFLRKDRVRSRSPVYQLPHRLDQPNCATLPDIELPKHWL